MAVFDNLGITTINLKGNCLECKNKTKDNSKNFTNFTYSVAEVDKYRAELLASPSQGFLEDLARLTVLVNLNLSSNGLRCFPEAICYLSQLEQLILSGNRIPELPVQIQLLTR